MVYVYFQRADEEGLDPTKAYYWGDKFKVIETDGDDFLFGYEGEDEDDNKELNINEEFEQQQQSDRNNMYTFNTNNLTVSDGKNAPVIIMQQYCQICDIMSRLIKESYYDFRKDPLYTPGIIPFFQSEMQNVRSVLQHGLRVDGQCAEEYRQFQLYWSEKRAAAATVVSELFEKANLIQTHYGKVIHACIHTYIHKSA